jgi:hypothetical protein
MVDDPAVSSLQVRELPLSPAFFILALTIAYWWLTVDRLVVWFGLRLQRECVILGFDAPRKESGANKRQYFPSSFIWAEFCLHRSLRRDIHNH